MKPAMWAVLALPLAFHLWNAQAFFYSVQFAERRATQALADYYGIEALYFNEVEFHEHIPKQETPGIGQLSLLYGSGDRVRSSTWIISIRTIGPVNSDLGSLILSGTEAITGEEANRDITDIIDVPDVAILPNGRTIVFDGRHLYGPILSNQSAHGYGLGAEQ